MKRQFNKKGKLRELAAKLKPESLFQSGTPSAAHVLRDKKKQRKCWQQQDQSDFSAERECDGVVRKDRKTERNQLQSKVRKFFNPVAV